MPIERSSLRSAESLPSSDESIDGGTNGSVEGTTKTALRRGFSLAPDSEEAMDPPSDFNSNHSDIGFLGRPHGWSR